MPDRCTAFADWCVALSASLIRTRPARVPHASGIRDPTHGVILGALRNAAVAQASVTVQKASLPL